MGEVEPHAVVPIGDGKEVTVDLVASQYEPLVFLGKHCQRHVVMVEGEALLFADSHAYAEVREADDCLLRGFVEQRCVYRCVETDLHPYGKWEFFHVFVQEVRIWIHVFPSRRRAIQAELHTLGTIVQE